AASLRGRQLPHHRRGRSGVRDPERAAAPRFGRARLSCAGGDGGVPDFLRARHARDNPEPSATAGDAADGFGVWSARLALISNFNANAQSAQKQSDLRAIKRGIERYPMNDKAFIAPAALAGFTWDRSDAVRSSIR